jgi:dTDP-4-dehydrorhamnose 3,5-epimerase-like enzyme
MNHFENNRDSDSRGVFLETLKNRFLAAIYRKDPEQTRHVYLQISGHAR